MDAWVELTWSRLGAQFDGPHATPTRKSEGPYFLNIASLSSGRLDLTQSDHVSAEDFSRWTKRVTPRTGDLLFSYETRLGEAALMPDGIQACLGRRMALLRPDPATIDPRFLLYYYLSPEFQRQIAERTVPGATVPRILLKDMPSWRVRIPGLLEQRAIAEVLGALDDKIAANGLVIKAAEKYVVALVGTLSERVPLSSLVDHVKESVAVKDFVEEVALYSLPAFDAGQLPEASSGSEIKSNKMLIDRPVVLVSKLNPRIPRMWDIPHAPTVMGLASTEFVALEPRGGNTSLLWAALKQTFVSVELAGMVAGTSGSHQRVKPAEVLALEVPKIDSLSRQAAEECLAIGRAIASLRTQSQTLARTRDALLPLLMSGRLRVKDLEHEIAEVL